MGLEEAEIPNMQYLQYENQGNSLSKRKQIHICFVNLRKAFDKINGSDVWENLKKSGIEDDMIKIILALYKNKINKVRTTMSLKNLY